MNSSQQLAAALERCKKDALLIRKERVDQRLIASRRAIAEENQKNAERLLTEQQWNSGFTLYYDSLHLLAEAVAASDKVKSYNHHCLFVHLCQEHPELDWEFLEQARSLRNRLLYYGEGLEASAWKRLAAGFRKHCQRLHTLLTENH